MPDPQKKGEKTVFSLNGVDVRFTPEAFDRLNAALLSGEHYRVNFATFNIKGRGKTTLTLQVRNPKPEGGKRGNTLEAVEIT